MIQKTINFKKLSNYQSYDHFKFFIIFYKNNSIYNFFFLNNQSLLINPINRYFKASQITSEILLSIFNYNKIYKTNYDMYDYFEILFNNYNIYNYLCLNYFCTWKSNLHIRILKKTFISFNFFIHKFWTLCTKNHRSPLLLPQYSLLTDFHNYQFNNNFKKFVIDINSNFINNFKFTGKTLSKCLNYENKKEIHPFHLVSPSLWPIATSTALLGFFLSLTNKFWKTNLYYLDHSFFIFFILLIFCLFCWFFDIIDEATYNHHHTKKVRFGLKFGMFLFLVSEALFFFSVFWAYFYFAIYPSIFIGQSWPPHYILAPDSSGLSFINTWLLLLSGMYITYAHSLVCLIDLKIKSNFNSDVNLLNAIKRNVFGQAFKFWCYSVRLKSMYDMASSKNPILRQFVLNSWKDKSFSNYCRADDWIYSPYIDFAHLQFSEFEQMEKKIIKDHINANDVGFKVFSWIGYTIIIGLLFTILQYIEYTSLQFNINDSVYGSIFFFSTGFHGFHVIVGIIFLFTCMRRYYHFSSKQHLGFEFAVWYWHFVDIIWIFLYTFVYWWTY